MLQEIFLDEAIKELLGKILRFFDRITAAANEGIQRRPIVPTQILQETLRIRVGPVSGGEHRSPVRRNETLPLHGDSDLLAHVASCYQSVIRNSCQKKLCYFS